MNARKVVIAAAAGIAVTYASFVVLGKMPLDKAGNTLLGGAKLGSLPTVPVYLAAGAGGVLVAWLFHKV